MLLVMGDFNAKVGRREPSAMSSAVGLYGLGETNEAGEQLEDLCFEHELALANTMFKEHPRRLYTWTSPDGNTRNQIDYISIAQRWKTSLMNCHTYPGADCDTDHQLLVATLKVRLAKRQRQNSIPPLNLEELKEDKAVQFATEVTNMFTALEAALNEVTPEDLWKGTKTVLLEVTRETIGSVKSQTRKKWIPHDDGRWTAAVVVPSRVHYTALGSLSTFVWYRASRLSACHIPGVACCIFTARC